MDRGERAIKKEYKGTGEENEGDGDEIGERKERREGGKKGGVGEKEEVVERMREIERRLERKERKDRKRNVIIRGLEVREEKRREAVEDIFEKIEARVEVEEERKLREEEGGVETVRMGKNEE